MNRPDTNPDANVPAARQGATHGDRGQQRKTWEPPAGEQGISNRAGDEDTAEGTRDDDDADRGGGRMAPRTPGKAEGD